MNISAKKENGINIVSLKGRMDALTSPDLEKRIRIMIAEGEKSFILDLEKLDYISSAGLRTILIITKELTKKKGFLFLSSLQQRVQEVFELSGFSSIIPIYGTLEIALSNAF